MNCLLDVEVEISGPCLLTFPPLSTLKSALHLTIMRNFMHKSFEDFYFFNWRFCLELDSWAKWIVLFTSYSSANHTSSPQRNTSLHILGERVAYSHSWSFCDLPSDLPVTDGGSWEVWRWRGICKEAVERLGYWTACNSAMPSNQILSLTRNSLESLICFVEIKKQFQFLIEAIRPQA